MTVSEVADYQSSGDEIVQAAMLAIDGSPKQSYEGRRCGDEITGSPH
jgi:hypothetical protein